MASSTTLVLDRATKPSDCSQSQTHGTRGSRLTAEALGYASIQSPVALLVPYLWNLLKRFVSLAPEPIDPEATVSVEKVGEGGGLGELANKCS